MLALHVEVFAVAKIGLIGGSGLEKSELLKGASRISVTTPYGEPSSELTLGTIDNVEVILIARHGDNHQFSPTEVNYRANISALKEQGVSRILATTACGSLRAEIERGDFIILDQFIDFTRHRINTFFESFADGSTHQGMADPFDNDLRKLLIQSANKFGFPVHETGTVVTIEGPRFSTRAESRMFRLLGADVINMSIASEAILANELEIPYAAIAMSTDYDCWKEDEPPVSWEEIMEVFGQNAINVGKVLVDVIPNIL